MIIYKEVKKIAMCNSKIQYLISLLYQKNADIGYGVYWDSAKFVSLTKEDLKYFEEHDSYYVSQSTGYLGDDCFGYLYFKTDVPGQYVEVYFEC